MVNLSKGIKFQFGVLTGLLDGNIFSRMKARRERRTYPDLKTYFDESGVTQEQFARLINRSQSWVSKVRNGQLEPSIKEALRISKLAGVPIESLSKPERAVSL